MTAGKPQNTYAMTGEKRENPYGEQYPMPTSILICECGSTEHQIVIQEDLEDGLVCCHIHLTKYGFWWRLKAGLKYIFGHTSRYGQWDEFILTPEHAGKLRELSEMLARYCVNKVAIQKELFQTTIQNNRHVILKNEIRVGNWVSKDGNQYPTTTDTANFIARGVELDGIPLDKDWLLKFGFSNIERTNIYVKVMYSMGGEPLKSMAVYLDVYDYTVALFDYYTGRKKTELLHRDYRYVHELQNLYHALTYSELDETTMR